MDTRPPTDLSCADAAPLIDDLADGHIGQPERAALDAHLARCASCRALSSDVAELRRAAGSLPIHAPRPEVWSRIQQTLAAEKPVALAPVWTTTRVALAMAAVVVLAVTASVFVLRGPWGTQPAGTATGANAGASAGAVHQSPEDVVKDVSEHLRIAEANYELAIAGLEKVVKSEQAALDPAVAATLQKNLGIIDKAIGESRDAIKTQPTSQLAQTSLFEALRQKVALLEDTIALINVMRKGDQAGAAKIIGGLSKS